MQDTATEIPLLNEVAKTLDGKLLRQQEIPLDSTTIHFLLANHYLQSKPAIKKQFFFRKCMRCGNNHPLFFAKIPCRACNKTHLYCRKCIEMGRIKECDLLYYWSGTPASWPKHIAPCSWKGELTTTQQTASQQIKKAIYQKQKELLVWAVTGAGKTEMLFAGITAALEMGMRICLATPRVDVVRELKPRFEQAFANVSIQALYGGSKEKDAQAQLILATTHQLFRFQEAFDVMIIDEIDAFPYHADTALPYVTMRASKRQSTMIYLTATPRKEQRVRIQNKKLPHVFVPIRYHGHPLPVPKMKLVHSLANDLKKNQFPIRFLTWITKQKKSKRQLLLFVPTISLAEKLKTALTKACLQADTIENETELEVVHAQDPDREKKIQVFREKKLKVMITTTILERGVTFPSVNVAVLDAGHAVFDEAALVQIAGRAGRSAADPTGEVIFFHDGKTEAMVSAIYRIKQMNKQGGFH